MDRASASAPPMSYAEAVKGAVRASKKDASTNTEQAKYLPAGEMPTGDSLAPLNQRTTSRIYEVNHAIADFNQANLSLTNLQNKEQMKAYLATASHAEQVHFLFHIITQKDYDLIKMEKAKSLLQWDYADSLAGAYQRLFTAHAQSPLPLAENIAEDAPVNFVWVGGLLPDRYLENIRRTATCQPQKEVVLWIDRQLLSEQQHQQMLRLPSLAELKKLNIKVLDINDAELNDSLNHPKETVTDLIHFAEHRLKALSVVSDILRYALLIKGPLAIDLASGTHTKRSSTAMIYMDTDRGPETTKTLQWGNMKAPAGFIAPTDDNSDVLATAYQNHPVFTKALENIADRFDDEGKSISLSNRYIHTLHRSDIIYRAGPNVLCDAFTAITGHRESMAFFPYLHFNSPVTGSNRCDLTWLPGCKADLSASWMSRLPRQHPPR